MQRNFPNLRLLLQNPNPSNLLSVQSRSSSSSFPLFSNKFSPLCCTRSLMASVKIVAEYAKSNRSSCKTCSETISSKSLRIGSVTKDPRGFDATKWHHVNCFPIDSQPIGPAEEIDGFDSLKSDDQEALKMLSAGVYPPLEEGNAGEKAEEHSSKKSNVDVVAEYAKSNRSSCKKCSETISAKSLRVGLVSRDPRGFDATKWHHLNCFPIDSQPIDSVEKINGFSELKSDDQEALKKLAAGESPEKGNAGEKAEVEGAEEHSSKKYNVDVVVEYAKSNRSSCKKCSEPISAKSLRVGLVSRNPRGFDAIKWQHLNCFPIDSQLIDSVEKIKGFSELKSDDQEALKKLAAGESPEKKVDEVGDAEHGERSSNKLKGDVGMKVEIEGHVGRTRKESETCEGDGIGDAEHEESCSKKLKLSPSNKEAELRIAFSSSDVKNSYKDATLFPKWKAFQTIIFLERDEGLKDSSKIAAFDFDGCLVKTSVQRVGADAWSLLYPSIPEKLRSLFDDGYKLVIFTNEANIERWKNKRQVAVDSKLGRLNNFIKRVNVPIQVFIACGSGKGDQSEDPFRKPKPGMWRIMEQHFNSGIPIDMDQSFYVGDAAGRIDDHSDADIKFAQAAGLKFYVPENYFAM